MRYDFVCQYFELKRDQSDAFPGQCRPLWTAYILWFERYLFDDRLAVIVWSTMLTKPSIIFNWFFSFRFPIVFFLSAHREKNTLSYLMMIGSVIHLILYPILTYINNKHNSKHTNWIIIFNEILFDSRVILKIPT